MQGSSGDANTQNRLVDAMGEGEGGMNCESDLGTYMLPFVKQIAEWELTLCPRELKPGAP